MPLSADPGRPGPSGKRRSSSLVRFESWNRRLHYYFGLYFLFFIWLFALTGLLLNHPGWARHSADRRTESRHEAPVDLLAGRSDVAQARHLMGQLGLEGEIDWPATVQPGRFDFNVSRPSDAAQVRVDLASRRASVLRFENTPFAAFRIFHTFNGSRYNAPAMTRDWIVTSVWTILMDAFAAGLLMMIFGSYYMWYRLKRTHSLGIVVLSAGAVLCGMFLTGLFWPYVRQ